MPINNMVIIPTRTNTRAPEKATVKKWKLHVKKKELRVQKCPQIDYGFNISLYCLSNHFMLRKERIGSSGEDET